MSSEAIHQAVKIGKRLRHVLVATADGSGMPHIAAAGVIHQLFVDQIAVEAWFCPGTVQNLRENKKIAIVAWDPAADIGHQLLGEVVKIEEIAMMDGFSPELDDEEAGMPQSRQRIIMRVDIVYAFSHAPHSDTVE